MHDAIMQLAYYSKSADFTDFWTPLGVCSVSKMHTCSHCDQTLHIFLLKYSILAVSLQ